MLATRQQLDKESHARKAPRWREPTHAWIGTPRPNVLAEISHPLM
jgi:hypothetical protein